MTIFLAMLIVLLAPVALAQAQAAPTEPTAPRLGPILASPGLPSRQLSRPFGKDEPIEIELAIYVIDIDDVDSAAQNFSGSVYYEAHWHSPALRHDGPGPLTRETTAVWTPRPPSSINSRYGKRSQPMSKYPRMETSFRARSSGARSRSP